MSERVTLAAEAEQVGQRLDKWLADTLARDDLSRSRLKALIQDGALKKDNQVVTDPSARVIAASVYSLTVPEAVPATPQPEPLPLAILYEDEHLICINKAAGMVVHPAPGALSGTLVNALLYHCGDSLTGIGGVARPGIVHRLDKDTSGVMIAAKTAAAHSRLTDMFAAHDLDRRYQALVWGLPAMRADTVDAALARHPVDRKRQAVQPRGRHAITHYTTLRDLPPFGCLIECRLETGRTHQIRVHMAHIGHGVIGDPLYGKPKRAGQMPDTISRDALASLRAFPRQALHAARLSFAHPITGVALDFDSQLPADMTKLITTIEQAIRARGQA